MYDFALSERGEANKTNAKKVLYEALYEAPLTRKTRLYTEGSTAAGFSEYFELGDLLHTAICYRSFRVMGYFYVMFLYGNDLTKLWA